MTVSGPDQGSEKIQAGEWQWQYSSMGCDQVFFKKKKEEEEGGRGRERGVGKERMRMRRRRKRR